MPPRDESEILSNAREAIAKVIGQLQRDRDALAARPQYPAGAEKASAALAAAVRLSESLQVPTAEHP
jgi:hypothetical protein